MHIISSRSVVRACLTLAFIGTLCAESRGQPKPAWQDPSKRIVLKNDSMQASFQSGLLYLLKDRKTNQILLQVDPAKLPAKLPLFSNTRTIDLDTCTVSQQAKDDSLVSQIRAPDGTEWELR